MSEFVVLYEQAGDGSWSASAAELPVFAVADTREDAEREIRSAIRFYLEELRAQGKPVPDVAQHVGTVEV